MRDPVSRAEIWPFERLKPYLANPRAHPAEQVKKLASCIKEFGFTLPVLVDGASGEVISGHARLLAAKRLALTEIPVMLLDGLSESERRAYRIADNRLTDLADWSEEVLREELADLRDHFDLETLGFRKHELADLLDDLESLDISDMDSVSRPGDLWRLGDHAVICGDATDRKTVGPLLREFSPVSMVTDPPYGVSYDASWRLAQGLNNTARIGRVENDDRADWSEAYKLFQGRWAYVWHATAHLAEVYESLIASGFSPVGPVIWCKANMVIGRSHYHWQHEPCWFFQNPKARGKFPAAARPSDVWEIPTDSGEFVSIHSTQKPLQAMALPVSHSTAPGDAVYDPFLGSGTTLAACQHMGRRCLGVEVSPVYVDIVIDRWQSLTGREAEWAGTAAKPSAQRRPWREMEMERKP